MIAADHPPIFADQDNTAHLKGEICKERFHDKISIGIAFFILLQIRNQKSCIIFTCYGSKIIEIFSHQKLCRVGLFRIFHDITDITALYQLRPKCFGIRICGCFHDYLQIFIQHQNTAQSLFVSIGIQLLFIIRCPLVKLRAQLIGFI